MSEEEKPEDALDRLRGDLGMEDAGVEEFDSALTTLAYGGTRMVELPGGLRERVLGRVEEGEDGG